MDGIGSTLAPIGITLLGAVGAVAAAAGLTGQMEFGPLAKLPRNTPLAIGLIGLGAMFTAVAAWTGSMLPFWCAAAACVGAGLVVAWNLARL